MMKLGYFVFSVLMLSVMYYITNLVYDKFFNFQGFVEVLYYGVSYTIMFTLINILVKGMDSDEQKQKR